MHQTCSADVTALFNNDDDDDDDDSDDHHFDKFDYDVKGMNEYTSPDSNDNTDKKAQVSIADEMDDGKDVDGDVDSVPNSPETGKPAPRLFDPSATLPLTGSRSLCRMTDSCQLVHLLLSSRIASNTKKGSSEEIIINLLTLMDGSLRLSEEIVNQYLHFLETDEDGIGMMNFF